MLLGGLICSCGSGNDGIPESVNLKSDDVYGEHAHLISISQDSATLYKKDGRLRIKVQLKLENRTDNDISIYPVIVLKDEDGMEIVDDWYQMEMSDSEKSKFSNFIKSEVGTTKEFLFLNEFSYKLFEEVLTKSHKFSLDKIRLYEEVKLNENNNDSKDILDVLDDLDDIDDEDMDEALEQAKQVMNMSKDMLNLTKDAMDLLKEVD